MTLEQRSVEQLSDMREKLVRSLHSLDPQVDPETTDKIIVKSRNLMLQNGSIEDKKIALGGFIKELNEKIFRVYLRLAKSCEDKNDNDGAADCMNQYFLTAIEPYLTESDPEKWNDAFRRWKKSEKTIDEYLVLFSKFQSLRYVFLI